MNILDHPPSYREGTRVLFLKGRHKDAVELPLRMISRISHDSERFDRYLAELVAMARPGERIYASIDARDVYAATRHFQHAQIEAAYSNQMLDFYQHLDTRWTSSLMQPSSRDEKLWLFDADSEDMRASLQNTLGEASPGYYAYATKSGYHFITRPFDRRKLSAAELGVWNDNALMLWGF